MGSGISGIGSAILAKKQGWDAFVSDMGSISSANKKRLEQLGVPYEENQHSIERIAEADCVMKSPGIPSEVDIVKELEKRNIPVISEIDWGCKFTNATLVGITGTNGKTTTCELTYSILKSAGFHVGCAGNIGTSFAESVATDNFDYYVLEVSSFQLDHTNNTRFHIACITNITEDHLDRYQGKMENYIQSKYRIALNQEASDYFLYCSDDITLKNTIEHQNINGQILSFGDLKTAISAAYSEKNHIIIQTKNTLNINMNELNLRGKHNRYNGMASAVMANLLDVRKDNIRESLSNFQNIEHRLESVTKVNGVEYINDSKATNVNSSWFALESMEKPVIWIAGGVDKGNNYTDLKPLVNQKVKLIICLGLDNLKIHQAFQSDVDMIINTQSAKEAVHVASRMSESGDAVLLSPACASFDLFDSYEERGRMFKAAVRNL